MLDSPGLPENDPPAEPPPGTSPNSNGVTASESPPTPAPPADTTAPETVKPAETGPHRRRWLWLSLAALLLAVVLYFLWPTLTGEKSAAAAKAAAAKGPAPIQVSAVKAVKGNIGVYVTGLGAITPISTVTVKSRVDGQLMTVHFKEGDLVHKGDPLIEIDPRPYEAVVVQTEGSLTRDQALLANARVDLGRYTTLLAQDAIPEQQLATQRALVTSTKAP